MFNKTLAAGLLLTAAMAGSWCARAADMPGLFPQPAYGELDPPPQMEFGTGWYLRGDVTAADEVVPRILGDVVNNRSDWGWGIGGGVGYKFNNYFRADITADYLSDQDRRTIAFDGTAERGKLQRWDSLVNGYIDLGTWGGLTPYIGAGVGAAGLRTSGTYTLAGATEATRISGRDTYNLAWAAMAGVVYSLSPHLLLDVGYRYLDLGSYRAPPTTVSQRPFFYGSKTGLDSQEVRVGVRYQID